MHLLTPVIKLAKIIKNKKCLKYTCKIKNIKLIKLELDNIEVIFSHQPVFTGFCGCFCDYFFFCNQYSRFCANA